METESIKKIEDKNPGFKPNRELHKEHITDFRNQTVLKESVGSSVG